MDRYKKVIEESRVETDSEIIKSHLEKILEKAESNAKEDVYKLIFSCIDLTSLNTDDSQESITALVRRVNDFDDEYPQYPNVAAICVYSNFAEVVETNLEVTGVDTAVVAAGFPSGQTFTAVKVADVALAVSSGANEVDVVMNLGYLRDQNYEELADELIELKHTAKEALLKVIIESGLLKEPQKIKEASLLALWSEADFIKTSTGKVYDGASLEAAYIMCECIKEYYEKTGRKVGFKAAGGIRSAEDALNYYTIVKEVLGEEWLKPELFRIGASSLANNLLGKMLDEAEVKYF